MKKTLLILLCTYSLTSFSQDFTKGDKLIGGNLSFSVFNANQNGPGYYNAGNIGILPSYSWFVKANLAMGIRGTLSYNHSTLKFASGEKDAQRYFNTGVSVFLKKYKPVKEKFGVYFENEVGGHYYVNKQEYLSGTKTKNEAYGMSYQFSPGVFYRFSKRFMGEGSIGGAFVSYYGGQGTHNFGIGATFLQNFNLGINYSLDKKS